MKIKLGNHDGQYDAHDAGATYILKAGAIMANAAGRAIDGVDDAAGKRFIIDGTVSGSTSGLITGNMMELNHAQNVVIGKSGIIDSDGVSLGLYGDDSRVVNRGIVKSSGDIHAGIVVEGQNINVVNSGTVIGEHGIRLGGDDATVTNSGYVSAVGIGVNFATLATESGLLVNTGTIAGGNLSVHGSSGEQTVVNSGLMLGSILFGDGADVFRNKGGNVVGTIYGGMGDDTFHVDKRSLDIVEAVSQGSDTVKSSVSWTLGDYFETGILTGRKNIDLTGNNDASTLYGNRGKNEIDGKGGVDFLNGFAGDDMLNGGAGADIFIFRRSSDRDTITDFEDGVDRINLSQYKGIDGLDDVTIKNRGDDVLITLGKGDTIKILGVEPDQLTDTDFIF